MANLVDRRQEGDGTDGKECVYIVTSGSYSDYHIVGVFTGQQEAADFADLFQCDGVEVWGLNPHRAYVQAGKLVWDVELNECGQVLNVDVRDPGTETEQPHSAAFVKEWDSLQPDYFIALMVWDVVAPTREHAVKIAHDYWAIIKAQRGWATRQDFKRHHKEHPDLPEPWLIPVERRA
jgi:hypothetical protein